MFLILWYYTFFQSKKVSRRITQPQRQVQPSKPKEMLYTRQINLSEAVQSDNSEQNCWKVIVSHRLDNKSIIGVVSLDAKLIILSIGKKYLPYTSGLKGSQQMHFGFDRK